MTWTDVNTTRRVGGHPEIVKVSVTVQKSNIVLRGPLGVGVKMHQMARLITGGGGKRQQQKVGSAARALFSVSHFRARAHTLTHTSLCQDKIMRLGLLTCMVREALLY